MKRNSSTWFLGLCGSMIVLACGPKEDTKTATGGGAGVATTGAPDIRATSYAPDLKQLGLEVEKLPKFAELTKEQKKGIMPLFSKSLGVPCATCHSGAGETANMRVAKKMWDSWVVGFKVTEPGSASGTAGGPVFCDSCHQGKKDFLARDDKAALGKWMKANLVDRHVSTSATANCARCHGEPFQPQFIATWKN